LAIFLVVAGLAGTGISAGYLFLYVFLGSLGAGPGLMGTISAMGALAEVPLMLSAGRLTEKWGAPPVFAVGMGLSALAWGLYSILQVPDLAPLIQLLNGAAAGLLWPAAVTYVARRAPSGRAATAQSLLGAVMFGIAPLAASQLAGSVFDQAGARAVLAIAAGTLAAGMLLSVLGRRWAD